MADVITRTEKGLPLTTLEADNNFAELANVANTSVRTGNQWIANVVVSFGSILISGENHYLVTIGGTTSNTAPTHVSGTEVNGTSTLQYFQPTEYSPRDVLNKLLIIDGAGSNLDSDTVDGLQPNNILPIGVNKSSIVSRDSSGNFTANVITANVVGNLTGTAQSSSISTNSLQLGGKTELQLKQEIVDESLALSIALG